MTNEEIADYINQVEQIIRNETKDPIGSLENIASQIGAPTAPGGSGLQRQHFLTNNIHVKLQSEAMLNTCVSAEGSSNLAEKACKSAKWSCFWAAIAAIAACASIVVMFFLR